MRALLLIALLLLPACGKQEDPAVVGLKACEFLGTLRQYQYCLTRAEHHYK